MNAINSPYLMFSDNGTLRIIDNPFFQISNNLIGLAIDNSDSFQSILADTDNYPFGYWGSLLNDIAGGYGGAEMGGTIGGILGGGIGAPIGAVIGGCLFGAAASGLLLANKVKPTQIPQTTIKPLRETKYVEVFSISGIDAGIMHNTLLNAANSQQLGFIDGSMASVNAYLHKFAVIAKSEMARYVKPKIPLAKFVDVLFRTPNNFPTLCFNLVNRDYSKAFAIFGSTEGGTLNYDFLKSYILTSHTINNIDSFRNYNNELLRVINSCDFLEITEKVKLNTLITIGYNSYCYWLLNFKKNTP